MTEFDDHQPKTAPSFYESFRFWLLLGFINFGGPAGQIAIMHHELVVKRKWISNNRFLHALNYCMLLPGPEAMQLAIYIGWLLHKIKGGIIAGLLFILPSVFIIWLLSYIYVLWGNNPWIEALFYGLKPAVVAIVASAVIRIGAKSLNNISLFVIAALSFIGIYFFNVPFPLIILSALLIGWLGGKYLKNQFISIKDISEIDRAVIHDNLESPAYTKPSLKRMFNILILGLFLWWIPVLFLGYLVGFESIIIKEALFFSKASMITFGGAYAVLSYVAQYSVEQGWLNANQMIDGLGLAETTPGPLIMVLQFVGFLGAWNNPGALTPLFSATLGAFITTWCTFVPSFIFIFLGGPYIEKFRNNSKLNATLSAVTAAVVGVILNLAVWFAIQVLFYGERGFDYIALIICLVCFIGLQRWKWGIIPVAFGSSLFGLFYKLLIV